MESSTASKMKMRWIKYITIDKDNPRTSLYRSIVSLNKDMKNHITSKWWYIVHPMSVFRVVWENTMIFVFFMQLISSPFVMTWQRDIFFTHSSDILKILCITNIFMTFFVGYIDKTKDKVELNPRKIAYNYVFAGGNFIMECIAAFPYTTFFICLVDSKSITRSFSWTCLFSLFYIYLILQYTYNTMRHFHIELKHFRLFRLILISITFFHWLTCLTCNEYSLFIYRENTYLTQPPNNNTSYVKMYWRCFFQTTALVTRLGFGLEEVTNTRNITPNLTTFAIGIAFYFYLLSELVCLDNSIIQPKSKYQIQIKLLDEYMRQRKLPYRAQKKIKKFYEYKFQRSYFQESAVLSSLPARLREEIVVNACKHLLQKSVLFKKFSQKAMSLLLHSLKFDIFFPNDVIIKAGCYGDCMFFLASGTVAVVNRLGKEIVHLQDGAYFGELALVVEGEKRVTSVLALEFCEVYRLDQEDFKRIISPYRKLNKEIKRQVLDRVTHSLIVGDPQQPITI